MTQSLYDYLVFEDTSLSTALHLKTQQGDTPQIPRRSLSPATPAIQVRPSRKIASLSNLAKQSNSDPVRNLRDSLDAVMSELFEFERILKVAFLNPEVVDAGRFAKDSLHLAESCWASGNSEKGNEHAHDAIYYQLWSLSSAYRVFAGHSIVEARTHIEHRSWSRVPDRLASLHAEARELYAQARTCEATFDFDRARNLFLEAVIVVDMIYVELDSFKAKSSFVQGPIKTLAVLALATGLFFLVYAAVMWLIYSLFLPA